ncbi:MAG: prepilin-type N-terminal cleavage/methylation domain-containing protein [Planctomycetota bacterium]
MTQRRRHHDAGFTLVELVATIVILAVVSAASSRLLLDASENFADASEHALLHSESSIALDRLVRELRAIDNEDVSGERVPIIDSIAASAITWESTSSLTLSGTDLQLTLSGGTTRTILGNVTAFTLEAFDESNAALSLPRTGDDCHAVRRIRVTVTTSRNGVTDTMSGKVFIRSMQLPTG